MPNIPLRFRVLVVGVVVATNCMDADAWFGTEIVYDPTHTAQTMAAEVARAADAAREISVEINQYQNMIANTIALRDPILAPIGNTFRSLSQVYWQGQSLMWRAQNMDQQFNYMYPGYQSYLYSVGQGGPTFSQKYRDWSERNNEGIVSSARVSGMTVRSGEDTAALLERMALQSSTAGGQVQAVQAGNQIAALQVQELLKLQAMIDAQIKMQANYLAIENERRGMDDAFRAQYRSAPVTHSPSRGF